MRRLAAIGAACLMWSCAGPGPWTGDAHAPSAATAALIDDLLAELQLHFTDPDDPLAEVYESSGPYEVVAVSPHRIELAGFDRRHLQPTTTIVYLDGDEVWVTVEIGERGFASRIR